MVSSSALDNPQSPGSLKNKEAMYNNERYDIVTEGLAEILIPKQIAPHYTPDKRSKAGIQEASRAQTVFYNPIQQYNRDLSVLAIRAYADDWAAIEDARGKRKAQEHLQKGRGKKRKREEANSTADDARKRIEGTNDRTENARTEAGTNDELQAGEGARVDRTSEITRGDSPQGSNPKANRPPFRILDALSATGLRALRYAKEIPLATSITANDLSASAKASIELNIHHNALADKINSTRGDAVEHMQHMAAAARGGAGLYQVIDLDPYGTAAPFLDAAVQAVRDGGLLCVTCTDAGVFASMGYLEKTFSQYGGLPLRGPHAHEGGLRLILNCIAASAARYGLAIDPLLSLSIDFYARVFVRIRKSPAEVKYLASKTMIVYSCDTGCGAWSIQHLAQARERKARNGDIFHHFTSALGPPTSPRCEHCGFKTHLAGPMWGGPLHNPIFIQRILDMLPTLDKNVYGTIPRIEGMLSMALDEALRDHNSDTVEASKSPQNRNESKGISEEAPTTGDTPSNATYSSSQKPTRPIPALDPVLRDNYPFFFVPSVLSGTLHCVCPPDAAMRGALMHLGYRTTRSHTKPGSIVTDAPWDVIWEVMREWIRQKSPIREGALTKGTAGLGIMQKDRSKMTLMAAKADLRAAFDSENLETLKEKTYAALGKIGGNPANAPSNNADQEAHNPPPPSGRPQNIDPGKLKIIFDEELGKEAQGKRLVRYPVNPPDWGPMNRAKGGS